MIKKILTTICFAALVLPVFKGVAQRIDAVGEIAPYVYPSNRAMSVNYQYLPGGTTYCVVADGGRRIIEKDLKTDAEVAVLFDAGNTRENKIDYFISYTVSPNKQQILLYTKIESVYRRSFTAECYVYEVRTRLLKPLSTEHPRQQNPVFSPDSRMIAFVADNNIYIKKLDYGSEVAVTVDGEKNKIINGVPDWTYEEEFTTSNSLTWSPDNLNLCYLKYNETDVPLYDFALYQSACHPQDQYAYYPGSYKYKYPVAGQPNSRVSIHSYDVETRKTKDIVLQDNNIEYIPRLVYGPDSSTLIAVTLNRDQNRMEIYNINPKSTVSKSIIVEESKTWLSPECYENITFGSGSMVLYSDRTGYTNLYEYSYTGSLLGALTAGERDVTDYYGKDAAGNVYYQQALPTPLDRTIAKKDRKGNITVISPETGWSTASFSGDMSLYVLNHSTAKTPPVYTLHNTATNKQLKTLENNADYFARYTGKITDKEFVKFKSDGVELNGYIIKPAGFDPSRRYPVVMTQYSGPGSQQVMNKWGMDWEYYFAQKGFVVVCADGRGTGARGREFSNIVYKRLGYYETIDQINVAREVAKLPFVDSSKIGICGWSYGGYETLMCVTDANSPFAAAVAIAPVTDWRYYDTVYAERYMQTPGQNNEGYIESAPIYKVRNIKCPVLLMHGTADDNVHLANTIEFVSQMQSVGVMGDMWLFPNMNHSINYCNARAVVYAKMYQHFDRYLR